MKRARRVALAVEAERRLQATLAGLGGDILAMRARRSWTQQQLANRAGIGRSVISRFEHGQGPIDVETVERIGLALGVPLRLVFGRDPRTDVSDAGHLAIQELVLGLGRRNGYTGQFELATRPAEPWRSVDVVLAHEALHRMICIECWNTIGDIGAAARSSARKVAELEAMAVGRWGEDAKVGLVWVVRATTRNRAIVTRYPEVFGSRFGGSSQRWVAAITEGAEPPNEAGLVWASVDGTRLFAWRRARDT